MKLLLCSKKYSIGVVFLFSFFLLALTYFKASSLLPNGAQAQSGEAKSKIWTERDSRAKIGEGIDTAALNRAFVDLAKRLSPSVVNIYTSVRHAAPQGRSFPGLPPGHPGGEDLFRFFFGDPFGGLNPGVPREQNSLGSGFVINSDGLIITNSHVVNLGGKKADTIMVKFLDDPVSSKGHEAEVLGGDEATDVAVIKLKAKKPNIQIAALGDSDKLEVGEWVIAIGNPFGHSHSVTTGIVSAMGRAIDPSIRANFIQTDASINPGNSGGPLFNLYGDVIGINTAIDARGAGIGFAIPVNTAKSIITQIVEKGEVVRGWIGVTISDLTAEIAESLGLKSADGALIQDVIPGEPAAKAGLKIYDVVVEINKKPVATSRDFLLTVGNLKVGETADLKVVREGKELSIQVKAAKRKSEAELAKQFEQESQEGVSNTGIQLTDLTADIKKQLGLDSRVSGAVVRQVTPGSAAAAAGIRMGDVIEEINRKKVVNASSARKMLAQGDNFLLKLIRGNASIILMLSTK